MGFTGRYTVSHQVETNLQRLRVCISVGIPQLNPADDIPGLAERFLSVKSEIHGIHVERV